MAATGRQQLRFKIRDLDESTLRLGLREVLFYEVWEPTLPQNLVRVFSTADSKGGWAVGQPYEKFFQTYKQSPSCYQLQWGENGPLIPLPGLALETGKQWQVAIRIRSYTKEQNKHHGHKMAFPVIQYYCDTTIYYDDLLKCLFEHKGTSHLEALCPAESKWLGQTILHQRFEFTFEGSEQDRIAQRAKAKFPLHGPNNHVHYWTSLLRQIWDQCIVGERKMPGYMLTGSPLTLPLDGSPFQVSSVNDSRSFESYAGLPSQSAWRLRKDCKVATEEWYQVALEQVLVVKGHTLKDFEDFSKRLLAGSYTEEELHDFQVILVRALTLFQTTHPYVGDYRWDKQWKRCPSDATVVQLGATLGDCEDTAIGTYFLAVYLLRTEWTSGVVQGMRRLLAIMGVPVGVSGRGRDPNCKLEAGMSADVLGVCHMYTVIVPFPMLIKALTGRMPYDKEYQFIGAKFGIPAQLLSLHNQQVAVMETTIQATAFYHGRDRENQRKELARETIKRLIQQEGDDPLMWMNYTTPHPLSCKEGDQVGELVHTRAYRMFTPALELFVFSPELVVGQRKVNIVHQGSFIVRKTSTYLQRKGPLHCDNCHFDRSKCNCGGVEIGVDALALFRNHKGDPSLERMEWNLTCNFPVSKDVYNLEMEGLEAFSRPPQEMTVSGFVHDGTVADPCMCEQIEETLRTKKELSKKYKSTVCLGEHKGDRILVFAWRLFDKTTFALMNKIKEQVRAKEVTMSPFGNGYAFVFHF